MPTHPLAGAIIVVSVAVAAAIAVYESPQARQFAEDVRRKIALALHALGEEINPSNGSDQPRFNRPEDAEGFLLSQGALGSRNAEPGVDADEETKRRQREELMYWNAVRLEKLERQKATEEKERPKLQSRGSSFEDFLQEDKDAERGTTFVYNSGADIQHAEGLRKRGGDRGLQQGAAWANPFSDEHHIEASQSTESHPTISPDASEKYEILSEGLYSANEDPVPTRETTATIAETLVNTTLGHIPDPPISLPDASLHEASQWGQEPLSRSRNIPIQTHDEAAETAFASIHAWADQTNASFYSPLPTTPRALSPSQAPQSHSPPLRPLNISIPVRSETDEFSDPPESIPGDVTPTTDSMSLAGSSAEEVWGPRSGATSERGVDVMSMADSDGDGEGFNTPGSWSEVASVVSEGDMIVH